MRESTFLNVGDFTVIISKEEMPSKIAPSSTDVHHAFQDWALYGCLSIPFCHNVFPQSWAEACWQVCGAWCRDGWVFAMIVHWQALHLHADVAKWA